MPRTLGGFATERHLVDTLVAAVPALWGPEARCAVEVRCHDQATMDLAVNTVDGMIAVEAKLTAWRRVLAQAWLHQYCADYCYIAMPADAIPDAAVAEARQHGLGVVAVTPTSSRIVVVSRRNTGIVDRWQAKLVAATGAAGS